MQYESLLSRLAETFSTSAHIEQKRNLKLLLIDHMPLTTFRNGILQFIFLDVASATHQLVLKPKVTSKSESVLSLSLKSLLKRYTFGYYHRFFGAADAVQTDVDIVSNVCRNDELDAIDITTTEFSIIQEAFMRKSQAVSYASFKSPDTVTYKGKTMPYCEALRDWYVSYMFFVNLSLAGVYYRFSVSKPREPRAQTFYILNEFVPIAMKFKDIYNPLFDYEVSVMDYNRGSRVTCTPWQYLCSTFPIFEKATLELRTCDIYGRTFSEYSPDDMSSFVFYTLRCNLEKIAGLFLPPTEKRLYSAFFYPFIFMSKALEDVAMSTDPFASLSFAASIITDENESVLESVFSSAIDNGIVYDHRQNVSALSGSAEAYSLAYLAGAHMPVSSLQQFLSNIEKSVNFNSLKMEVV